MNQKINSHVTLQTLPRTLENFIAWDDERGITQGSSAQAQWEKLFEEVIELYAALNPQTHSISIRNEIVQRAYALYEAGKIKAIPKGDDPQEHVTDAVGDSLKCLTSVANLSNVDIAKSAYGVLQVINARTGTLDPNTGIWNKD